MKLLHVAALVLALFFAGTAEAQMGGGGFGGGRQRQHQTQPPSPLPKKQEKQFPVPSSWIAISLNGKPFTGIDRPTFSLDQQYRAKGFGGCNTFSATAYPLREQRFAVGPLALTKKQCDKAVMESEHAYFVALRTAMQWDLDGVTLVIKGPNGELRFDRSI